MPDYRKLNERRIKEATNSGAFMDALVRSLQAALYGLVIDWVSGKIETVDGRMKYSASNLGKVAGLYLLFDRFSKSYQKTVLGGILDRAARIFGLTKEYYDEIKPAPESVQDAARRLTLQRWGYNVNTKELIPGGYMEKLFANEGVARNVAGLVNRAIAGKMSLADFQKQFRKVFIGRPGQGMLERYWKTNSFDLFQKIDRAANLVYADRLGLEYAIYSGTVMDTTRPWCENHVNKVFSRDEIDAWKNQSWQGKITIGYDPYLDAGGFNCRHHWSFISTPIAEHLRPELKK
jgi:hypothetical protein